jgi:SAM-dependent methyltransferase
LFYKIKLSLYKNSFIKNLYWKIFKSNKSTPEIRHKLIKKYAPGKTFVDIGCMWGVNGYFTFLSEEYGAKQSVGFDIYEPSEEFKKSMKQRNSNVKFVKGDINSQSSLNELGKFDVVYCTGLLYHVPDPLYTLTRLRQVCGDILILGTAVIPEVNGLENAAVYYPFLSTEQRKLWDLKKGEQIAITSDYDPKQGYGNWIWGFSTSCLVSMLRTTGFDIIEKHEGKFYSYIVCKLSEHEFLPVSGDWIKPSNMETISKYRFDQKNK